MKWFKAGLVGVAGALVMFIGIMFLIRTGQAPFNLPPSAAFLEGLGLPPQPLGLIVHFLYGAFWSTILVVICEANAQTGLKAALNLWFPTPFRMGIGLALMLWLVMMVIYSPMLGWGIFGFGGVGQGLPEDDPLYLGSPIKYMVGTLVLHLIYGAMIGWLNPVWIRLKKEEVHPKSIDIHPEIKVESEWVG